MFIYVKKGDTLGLVSPLVARGIEFEPLLPFLEFLDRI